MSNMVKVSYAVDLDDVPKVASYLFDEATALVEEVREQMTGINFSKDNIATLRDKVHELRTTLAKIDQRVDDCYAITAGYHESILQPQTQEAPLVTGLPEDQVQATAALSEKIMELQKAMATGGENE